MLSKGSVNIKDLCLAKLHKELQMTLSSLENSINMLEMLGNEELSRQKAFKDREERKLMRIQLALERERLGTYGYCQKCGVEMWDRLLSLPYAELCTACQHKLEAGPYPMTLSPLQSRLPIPRIKRRVRRGEYHGV